MQPKNYQKQALEALEFFVDTYSSNGYIEKAFKETREKFEFQNIPYAEYSGLDVPSVCFRIPTGGGKTLLGAFSIPILVKKLFNTDSALIFWVAPSTPIVNQTINILKNPKSPIRQYLEQQFKDRTINVLTISEAYNKAFDLSTELPIIVSTIQTFGIENEEQRKFYEENGTFQDFFTGKDITPSLSNAIKQSNPIIIMDEAHNAKTDLRVNKLIELNPSFMLELTATPQLTHNEAAGQYASNILYTVSASQLKAEEMIKLPIVVETINKWEVVISEAISKRHELEKIASLEPQYIRPMILFKAEANRNPKSITANVILEILMNDFGIPREEIAVDTGEHEDLKDVDLMAKDCEIRYVITVDKLKEGWDAPFAYILGAIGEMKSSTAVEQILGRVLRLPYASSKQNEELEKAYAYIASTEMLSVMSNLRDTLIDNGFEKLEAQIHITTSQNSNQEADQSLPGLFASKPAVKLDTFDITAIPSKQREFINHNKDTKEFTIVKRIPEKELSRIVSSLKGAVSTDEERAMIDSIISMESNLTNFKNPFSIPKLMAKTQEGFLEFEKTILLENITWDEKFLIQNASLGASEFSVRIRKDIAEIDISDRAKLQIKKLDDVKENLFSLNGEVIKLSEANIASLVLKNIRPNEVPTLTTSKLHKFILLIVMDLVNTKHYSTIELKANLHLLTEAISKKIKSLEGIVISSKYKSLFEEPDFFHVNPSSVFTFDPENYPIASPFPNPEMFKKHYYKLIDRMNGEEAMFASYIDGLEEVEFWVRNIEKEPKYSFWLQTSSDKFYPDFLIKLKNGKIIVAEWKREDWRNLPDTLEKETLGNAWASLYEGVEFGMLFKSDFKVKIESLLK